MDYMDYVNYIVTAQRVVQASTSYFYSKLIPSFKSLQTAEPDLVTIALTLVIIYVTILIFTHTIRMLYALVSNTLRILVVSAILVLVLSCCINGPLHTVSILYNHAMQSF